jgi:hypothetical protein
MTPAANFAAGTAEGVDIRGKLPPASMTPEANNEKSIRLLTP